MEQGQNAFLGSGWGFPPEFTPGGGNVRMVSLEDDIRESLFIILGTRIRERAMHSTFGCDLHRYLFAEISAELETGLRQTIGDALLQFEPRIDVEEVNVNFDEQIEGRVSIDIHYTVRTTNARFNMVYPFYLNEATSPEIDI